MTLYSVYEPPSEAPDLEDRADSLVFVKDGFSWPALFVPLLWLLYRRMWIELVLFLGLFLVLCLGVRHRASRGRRCSAGWASRSCVLFAFEANDLRSAALERRGYRQMGTAAGATAIDAELAFFRSWLPRAGARTAARGRAGSGQEAGIPAPRTSGEAEEVIGLFPRP